MNPIKVKYNKTSRFYGVHGSLVNKSSLIFKFDTGAYSTIVGLKYLVTSGVLPYSVDKLLDEIKNAEYIC